MQAFSCSLGFFSLWIKLDFLTTVSFLINTGWSLSLKVISSSFFWAKVKASERSQKQANLSNLTSQLSSSSRTWIFIWECKNKIFLFFPFSIIFFTAWLPVTSIVFTGDQSKTIILTSLFEKSLSNILSRKETFKKQIEVSILTIGMGGRMNECGNFFAFLK